MVSAHFILRLCDLVGHVRPLTNVQVQDFLTDTRPRFMGLSDSPAVFAVSADGASRSIKNRGSYTTTAPTSLDADAFDSTVASLEVSLIEIATGVAMIRPERNCQNAAIHDKPLPCLPHVFAALQEAEFVNLVVKMRSCSESRWSASIIDALEADYRRLRTAAFSDGEFKSSIE